MASGPPKMLEGLAKALIPPACREEMLGDLYERYKSPAQYLGDLVSALPFVILSRIIRTTHIRLLLMDALIVYGSFLAAAWYVARTLVTDEGGLMRLAVPSGLTLLGLLISEAFTPPLKRPPSDWIRSFGIKLALIALCKLSGLATEANFYGLVVSLMLVSTARLMFEPDTARPQGAGGLALPAGQESRLVSRTGRVSMTLILLAVTCWICWGMVNRIGVNP
jgi:hypothetical protein